MGDDQTRESRLPDLLTFQRIEPHAYPCRVTPIWGNVIKGVFIGQFTGRTVRGFNSKRAED